MYQELLGGPAGPVVGVVRLADGASIPADPANRDWMEYLAWKDAGNTPDPPADQTP